jgi:hypothetical protein
MLGSTPILRSWLTISPLHNKKLRPPRLGQPPLVFSSPVPCDLNPPAKGAKQWGQRFVGCSTKHPVADGRIRTAENALVDMSVTSAYPRITLALRALKQRSWAPRNDCRRRLGHLTMIEVISTPYRFPH